MKYDPRQLVSYYNRLAPRERVLLNVATIATLVIFLYTFVWDPLQTDQALLVRRITAKQKELNTMPALRDTYLKLKRQIEASEHGGTVLDTNFNLFAYVQKNVSAAVKVENIISMNPSTHPIGTDFQEEQVEIKMQKLDLDHLIAFLYTVEKGEQPLHFSRLQIKKRPQPDIYNFDVTATISLLKSVEKAPEKPAERAAERTLGS